MLSRKTLLFLLINLMFLSALLAQKKYTISGYVKDGGNGESLIGTNVYAKENLKGVSTNHYGFYSLTLDEGTYNIVVSFIGFQDYEKEVVLDKNLSLNVELQPNFITTQEVVISAKAADQNIQSTEMGKIDVPIEAIKTLPAFFGEVDVLKAIQLLPGVQSSGEGNTGFYVRGGGPDQNLVLLDEATVYNAGHLFGFFSVFNADAVKSVELTKAGMPANYGGRLASVLDVHMKDGNMKKYEVEGGVGLIFSRLTVQGPIKKDTCSFIVSARRTYIDVLLQPFLKETSALKNTDFFFYDLNAKMNYVISPKDRIFLSGYYGRDVYGFKSPDPESKFRAKFFWGNGTGSLRWNRIVNSRLFMNNSFIFSDYKFGVGMTQDIYDFSMMSGVRDWNLKSDFTFLPSTTNTFKFGAQYMYHIFTPTSVDVNAEDLNFEMATPDKIHSHELSFYVNDEFEINEYIKINAGLRYSLYQHIGPFDRYILDNYDRIDSTISYNKFEPIATYHYPEPRISARFKLGKNNSVKASYTQNYQYIHQVSLSSISLPTDLWFPSTSIVKPQYSVQYSTGYYHNFFDNMFETSLELYYKDMKNLLEYKEGVSPVDDVGNNPDNNYAFGNGWSYGGEVFLKKARGDFNGWIGYTLSWTERQFEDINFGKKFYAKYDRRHDVSVALSYQINKRLNSSVVWVYSTGNTMTIPIGRYFVSGNLVTEYSEKNEYRLPPYHRMDLSVTYLLRSTNRFDSELNFSVYNVYNRRNPFVIFLETTGDLESFEIQTKAKQMSLFPILPSISWNFKFK
ncbi:MAG: TonB-dependent receptor [Bacteroidales bacterium]|nr:TonB-dependent receptor [Bacteroidales bacterium]